MKMGTQIVYVPLHANGNVDHPDCEAGFVTSLRGDTVWCRYWSKHCPGELRTKANSEATPLDLLVFTDTRPQDEVDRIVATLLPLWY